MKPALALGPRWRSLAAGVAAAARIVWAVRVGLQVGLALDIYEAMGLEAGKHNHLDDHLILQQRVQRASEVRRDGRASSAVGSGRRW
jgi:hypothetical protein